MLEAEELEASRRYMESLLDSHMRWSGSMHSLNDGVLFSASRTSEETRSGRRWRIEPATTEKSSASRINFILRVLSLIRQDNDHGQ